MFVLWATFLVELEPSILKKFVTDSLLALLADRTNGHAYATVLRPSVCLSVCL